MADEYKERTDSGGIRIQPASIDLTAKSAGAAEPVPATKPARNLFILTGLGILVAAACAVVFLLPRWTGLRVVDPQQAGTATTPATPAAVSSTVTAGPPPAGAASPWERAQESKLRKETQETLAQMLEAQEALEDHAVMRWAETEFLQAMEYAQSGDLHYNQRDFTRARSDYLRALADFTQLVHRIDTVFAETMQAGNAALEAGASAPALQAFELLLAIDPLDQDAALGLQRSGTLDEVLALIDSGDDLLADGQLEPAREFYQRALDLDGQAGQARQRIGEVDDRILARDFNRHMSSGFAALKDRQYQQARSSFTKAQQLRPKSVEARAGMQQTEHAITTARINTLLDRGRAAESEEAWHEAVSAYDTALELDASLAEAQSGRDRSATRDTIHQRLKQAIADPKRLYDRAVYEDTRAFHQKVSQVSDPGPVLAAQLRTLGDLLARAATPVSITLRSDNLTRVTIYKVGELGSFHDREMTLLPGRYVAVGVRAGYQDVRQEIFVDPERPQQVITIQADQRIGPGN